jgi:hypothetical protein
MWLAYVAENITKAVAYEIEKLLIKAFGRMGLDKNGLLLNRSRSRSARAPSDRRNKFPLKTRARVVPHAHLPFKVNGRPSRKWIVTQRVKPGYPDNGIIKTINLPWRSPETSFYRNGMTVGQLKRKWKQHSRSLADIQANLIWDVMKGRIRIRRPRRNKAVPPKSDSNSKDIAGR